MTVALATPMSGFRLRACAVEFAAATPSTSPVISALGWVDVRTPGNRTHWAGSLAPVVASGSTTGAPTGEAADLVALLSVPAPHVLVAHGASALRMGLPAAGDRGLPWICTHKASLHVWPGADGRTLGELVAWRGLDGRSGGTATAGATRSVVERARLTALLVTGLLRHASLNQLLLFSQVITRPPAPPPAVADDDGWRLMPDDDLHWIARIGDGLDPETRERSGREIRRRVRDGRAQGLKFDPPVLPEYPDSDALR